MAKIGSYIIGFDYYYYYYYIIVIILLLLSLSLSQPYLLKIDRSNNTNKKYLCDSNFEMYFYFYMNIF